MIELYTTLSHIAQQEFDDIIENSRLLYRRAAIPLKLRLFVCDGTFVDVWLSPDNRRYSYHWEQRAVRGIIHRHDNAPDHPEIDTFPKHFHDGAEDVLTPSTISDDPASALREFLQFIREQLTY